MKNDKFIYKLLILVQTWFLGILTTQVLIKNNILTFSRTKSIFLFQFILSCIVISLIFCVVLTVIIFIISKIKKNKES